MPSFDIVSKVPWNEVDNALNQAEKEISQRFDFKDTATTVEKTKEQITIRSSSEDRALAALDVVQEKLIKRKVSLKFLDVGDPEASGKNTRITIKVKEGIESEPARKAAWNAVVDTWHTPPPTPLIVRSPTMIRPSSKPSSVLTLPR